MGKDKEIEELCNEIAHLESVNDHLYTEMKEIDHLLKKSGFPRGLHSLKATAEEMLRDETDEK